ncbi:MAG: hypothetical protein P1V35_09460, partial [Planctomycetota bacterium]|nr:hypothetical protein [Planctomycetota bacterium]
VTAPVSAEGMQGLAKVDPSGVEHSVPTDLGAETQASIEPMVFEDPMFEIQEIGMVPAPTEVTIDWVDPLSDWLPTEGHNAKTPVTEDSNLAQRAPEQTTETDSLFEETGELELPVLVGELEGEASLLVDGTEGREDGELFSANAEEAPAEATSVELVEGEELAQVLVDDVVLTEDESTLDRQVEEVEESAIAQMLPEVEGAGEQAAESTDTPVA